MTGWLPWQRLAASALLALAVHVVALLWPLAPVANRAPTGPLAVSLTARPAQPAAPALLPPVQQTDSAVEHALATASAPQAVPPPDSAVDAPMPEAPQLAAATQQGGGGLDPYYPASELDVLAAPIGPLTLDFPRVNPQELQLELYIGSDGAVDRVEVIAGNADSDYARYVLASFRQARFVPALKAGVAVRSRKHIRVALQQP